jgi:GTPase SAR1 family protein
MNSDNLIHNLNCYLLTDNVKFNNILKKIFISNNFIEEQFEDNIEYKWKLDNKNSVGLKKLVTQMLWRLNEGKERYGIHEAHYVLGIYDSGEPGKLTIDDLDKTINVFKSVVNKANCYISEECFFNIDISYMYYAYLRKIPDHKLINQKYLMLIGNSGVGKTTLLSSLCYDLKDNGNGYSRNFILKHKHEKIVGKTQTFKKEILGIDCSNNIINYSDSSIEDIYRLCNNIINVFDTPGFNTYQINLLYILSSIIPNMMFYINKSDNNYNDFIDTYCKYFNADIKQIIISENILHFSNITHNNINEIHDNLKLLKSVDNNQNTCMLNNCFRILDVFNVNSNTIVSGIQCIGHLSNNVDIYVYNYLGDYIKCSIDSIYKYNIENKNIYPNESGELKLIINSSSYINKQMIITDHIIADHYFRDIVDIKLISFNNNQSSLTDETEYLVFIGNMHFYGVFLKNKLIFNNKVLIQNKFAILYNILLTKLFIVELVL